MEESYYDMKLWFQIICVSWIPMLHNRLSLPGAEIAISYSVFIRNLKFVSCFKRIFYRLEIYFLNCVSQSLITKPYYTPNQLPYQFIKYQVTLTQFTKLCISFELLINKNVVFIKFCILYTKKAKHLAVTRRWYKL